MTSIGWGRAPPQAAAVRPDPKKPLQRGKIAAGPSIRGGMAVPGRDNLRMVIASGDSP
jgi:hypothetical protein